MTIAVQRAPALILVPTRYDLKRDDENGHVHRGPRRFPLTLPNATGWRQGLLAFLRDHVNTEIPRWYYQAMLGHPIHTTQYGSLQAKHFHSGERDPFRPLREGWWENRGVISMGKVTTAFRDFESNALRTDTTEYGDFKFHEVGTSATGESNAHTGLQATSGITLESGTQVGSAPDYVSVATVTADASETWQEHGLFSKISSGTMLDRSTYTGIAVTSSDQVAFTYTLTKTAES